MKLKTNAIFQCQIATMIWKAFKNW